MWIAVKWRIHVHNVYCGKHGQMTYKNEERKVTDCMDHRGTDVIGWLTLIS